MSDAAYFREYYLKNKEARLASAAEYVKRNEEKTKQYHREYFQKNKDKYKEYRESNREAINARKREAYAADEGMRIRYRKSTKEWQLNNPEKRSINRLKKYGITPSDRAAILQSQYGKCAICQCDESGRKFHIDHCHSTGTVRGLLCEQCNLGIGKFKDDPDALERAAMYLRMQGTQDSHK